MESIINAGAQKLKTTGKAKFMDFLKNEVEKSPLGSNLFFGLVLVLLEKLVEVEFSCPCNSKYNAAFGSTFFVLPGILSFVLMVRIRGCKWEMSMLLCGVPPIVWLILTFLDGQYFACAKTYWSGSYQTVPQSTHQKWCKPDNTSNETAEELLRMTQHWFSLSQGIGMGFILFVVVCIITGIYFMIKNDSKQNNSDPETNDGDGDGDADADADASGDENQRRSCERIELQDSTKFKS